MLSQKKALITLTAGVLLFGQVLVGAEEAGSSSSSSVPVLESTASSAILPSSSEASGSSMVEASSSSSSSQELPVVSSSTEALTVSGSQEVQGGTETELTASSSSQATSKSSSTTSSSKPTKSDLKLNLSQLAAKNYASLAGIWKSADGTTLLITKEGVIYTKGANGGYMSLDGLVKDKSQALVMPLKSHPNQSSAGFLYLAPVGQGFVKPGQADFKDKTDQTKDRFSFGEPYDTGRETAVFYRISTKLDDWNKVTEDVTGETAPSSSASAELSQTETELSLPPASMENSSRQEEVAKPTSSSSTHSSSSSPSSAVGETPGSTGTSSSTATASSSSSELSGSDKAILPTLTPQVDPLAEAEAAMPRTRTVVRRILPSTGERLGLFLPALGLFSLLLVGFLKKRQD